MNSNRVALNLICFTALHTISFAVSDNEHSVSRKKIQNNNALVTNTRETKVLKSRNYLDCSKIEVIEFMLIRSDNKFYRAEFPCRNGLKIDNPVADTGDIEWNSLANQLKTYMNIDEIHKISSLEKKWASTPVRKILQSARIVDIRVTIRTY